MQTTIYSGREDENYVETRIRLYQERKDKTSPSVPPDPDSVEQETTKRHMQDCIWKRCYLEHIDYISYEENGWKDEGNSLIPKQFSGPQLPPTLTRKRHRQKPQTEHETDADEETSGSEEKRGRKRKRNRKKRQVTIPETMLSIYAGDDEKENAVSSE